MIKHGTTELEHAIDFSVNRNPMMTLEKMESLLLRFGNEALVYPSLKDPSIRRKMADYLKVDERGLIMGNGAIELLYFIANHMPKGPVLIVEPTFGEYRQAFSLYGWPIGGLTLDMKDSGPNHEERILKALKVKKPALLILCNPNNPTGYGYDQAFLSEVLDQLAKWDGLLLLDESFAAFEGMQYRNDPRHKNLLVLTSMTKYFGILGLRLGCLHGSLEIIHKLRTYRYPWAVNHLALKIGAYLTSDMDFYRSTKAWYEQEKYYMEAALSNLSNIDYWPSKANYFMFQVKGEKSHALQGFLNTWKQSMDLRTLDEFPGLNETFYRIGLRDRGDNQVLIQALKEFEEVCYG